MIHKLGNLEAIFGRPFTGDGDIQDVPLDVQVKQSMLSAEIKAPDTIHFDGNLHRFSTKDGDPSDDSGWYVLFGDGVPAGRFGNWRTGEEKTFRANIGRVLTSQEEMQIAMRHAEAQKRRAAETAKKRETAAEQVAKIWAGAMLADDQHPYLARKGVKANGCRVGRDGRLMAPLYDRSGQLSTLQYISDDGTKRYHPGGATGSRFWMLGIPGDRLYIAEGYATAATIYETTGIACAVAYSANNLEPATGELRSLYPTTEFVIVADNDASKVGQNHAEQAAAKHGATVIIPPELGDANDYAKAGHDLKSLLEPPSEYLARLKVIKGSDLSLDYEPLDEIIQDILVAKTTAVLYGDSNSGKTFFAVSMAYAISEGRDFHGKKVDKGIALYLATEAPGSIKNRMQALKKYYSSSLDNFYMVPVPLNFHETDQDVSSVLGLVNEIEKATSQKVRLIVADTLARMASGANENSGEDMGPVMSRFSRLADNTSACVLIIHHSGKDQARGARGWSGMRAHIETELEAVETDKIRTVTIQKQRDLSTKGLVLPFDLEIVEMGIGKFGNFVSTCVAIQGDREAPEKIPKHIFDHMRNFKDAWFDSGCEVQNGFCYVSSSAIKTFLVVRKGKSEATAKQYSCDDGKGMMSKLKEASKASQAHHGWIMTDLDFLSPFMASKSASIS